MHSMARLQRMDHLLQNREVAFGDLQGLPWSAKDLLQLSPEHPDVVGHWQLNPAVMLFRLRHQGQDFSLKRLIPHSLAEPDEQAFRLEIQRRRELESVRVRQLSTKVLSGVSPTLYGSLRQGMILCHWWSGEAIDVLDTQRLQGVYQLLLELEHYGFYPGELWPGHWVVREDRPLLITPGMLQRYNPLTEPNPFGWENPHQHVIERFETGCLFSQLLRLEQHRGLTIALDRYIEAKRIAYNAYLSRFAALSRYGASPVLLDWHMQLLKRWELALSDTDSLFALYCAEGYRSWRFLVQADLVRQKKTRFTQLALDKLQELSREQLDLLRQEGILHDGDEHLSPSKLQRKFQYWQRQFPCA